MKLKIFATILFLILTISACADTSIGCDHIWREADCLTPKTCTLCGNTEGAVKSHDWAKATCTEPRTCNHCGETSGRPAGHDYTKATCTTPATCEKCGITEGNALEHNYSNASCTAPATCQKCNATTGEALGHDFNEATCTSAKNCKRCRTTEGKPLGHNYKKNICTVCDDKMIESYYELCRYLRDHYRTIETPLGKITGITFDVEDNDPPLYVCYDYDLRIETDLRFSGTDVHVFSALGSDYYSYEDRLQTMVCLIEYLHEVGQIAIEAFPDKRVRGCFFREGYEYPSLEIGYFNYEYMTFVNYDGPDYGSYHTDAVTTEWMIQEYKGDSMNRYFSVPDKLKQEAAALTGYTINFTPGD